MNVLNASVNVNWPCRNLSNYSPKLSTFRDCLMLCAKNKTCETCYWSSKNICFHCDYGAMRGVIFLGSGMPIGWKVNATTANVCPKRGIMMTFNPPGSTTKKPTTKYIPTTTRLPTTTTRRKTCPDTGWILIRNTWCIVVPYTKNGHTQATGLSYCQGRAGALTNVINGLEWLEELDYLKGWAQRHFNDDNSTLGIGIWINGIQTKACTTNCFPSAFTLTDPHLKTFNGTIWQKNSKGAVDYGGLGTCLQFMAPKNVADPRFGRISAVSCTASSDTAFVRRATLCGALAL